MPPPDSFQCSVITPERKVLECDAKFVAFPAHDGEIGVLRDRAPLVCMLGIGSLRIESTASGHDPVPTRDSIPSRDRKGARTAEKHVFFIDGGFAQMVDNRLTILTEQARRPEELDAAAAERLLADARAVKITDEASYVARAKAIGRAQAQLKLVRRSG